MEHRGIVFSFHANISCSMLKLAHKSLVEKVKDQDYTAA